MRKLLTSAIAGLLLFGASLGAQSITFMPQWTPQAQFAGFYVAAEKGFYAAEGLDVTIKHIGLNSTSSVLESLLSGDVQIAGQQMLQSMINRSDGAPIVNVMQITEQTGLMAVSRTPVKDIMDLADKKVGRWKVGYSEICEIIENKTGMFINWVPFINSINLYLYGAVDATLCYSYSEFIRLKLAVGDIPEENVIYMGNYGENVPEDGLYVTEKYYENNKEAIEKFVRASKKGWDYVREHVDEGVAATMKLCQEMNIPTNTVFQKMMLEEYLRLQVNPETGVADYAQIDQRKFDSVMETLLEVGITYNKVEHKDMIR